MARTFAGRVLVVTGVVIVLVGAVTVVGIAGSTSPCEKPCVHAHSAGPYGEDGHDPVKKLKDLYERTTRHGKSKGVRSEWEHGCAGTIFLHARAGSCLGEKEGKCQERDKEVEIDHGIISCKIVLLETSCKHTIKRLNKKPQKVWDCKDL